MAQQLALYFAGSARKREHVSDDRLVLFVNAEDVSRDMAVFHGDKTGQCARIKVLEEEVGGGAIVPAQALAPEMAFFLQHRPQVAGGEVPGRGFPPVTPNLRFVRPESTSRFLVAAYLYV